MKDFVEYTNATLQWRSCIEGLKARACNFQRRETKRYILCVIYKNVDSIKDVIVQMSSPVLHYFQNPYIQKIIENLYHKNFLGGVTNFFLTYAHLWQILVSTDLIYYTVCITFLS